MNIHSSHIDASSITVPAPHRERIAGITDTLEKSGYQCYLVGGSVRDHILGLSSVLDYDLATDARPEEIMKLFKRVIPTGIKHGTVTLLVEDGQYEVTTFRSDGTYSDGRRPDEVRFSSSLREDVERRDFTINGLAWHSGENQVIDHVGGLDDLSRGIIRTIGNPVDRFHEDGLRPYRACRLASKLSFTIDEETFDAIGKSLHVASNISVERVRDEFMKILVTPKPSVGIELLRKSGLLALFLPELDECYGVDQNRFHKFDVYYHSVYACDAAGQEDALIRLAALLHDIGKVPTRRMQDNDYTFYNHEVVGARMVRRLMKRLKFSNDDIQHVNNLVVNHMFHYTDEWTDGAVRRFMRKVGIEHVHDLFRLREADRKGNGSRQGLPAPIRRLEERIEKVLEQENAITVRDLNINGYDLMKEYGLQSGPLIGKVLNELLERVLDDPEINTGETLRSFVPEILEKISEEN